MCLWHAHGQLGELAVDDLLRLLSLFNHRYPAPGEENPAGSGITFAGCVKCLTTPTRGNTATATHEANTHTLTTWRPQSASSDIQCVDGYAVQKELLYLDGVLAVPEQSRFRSCVTEEGQFIQQCDANALPATCSEGLGWNIVDYESGAPPS